MMNFLRNSTHLKKVVDLKQVRRKECFYAYYIWRNFCSKSKINSSFNRRLKSKGRKHFFPLLAFSFSIPFFGSKEDEEEEDPMITVIKRGVLATRKEEYKKAEQLLHIALKLAQERMDELAITYIFDLLANLAYTQDDFEKAEILFRNVLNRLISDGMELTDNALIAISLKLAHICWKRGDNDMALEGFHFCIATLEAKVKESSSEEPVDEDIIALLAMSKERFGEFLLSLKQYKLARENFMKSYDVCVDLKGPSSCHSAILLNNLGTVEIGEEHHEEGVNYIKRAINIAKNAEDCEKQVTSFYTNLGIAYLMSKDNISARLYCTKGLKLAKKQDIPKCIEEAEQCLKSTKDKEKTYI